MVTASDLKKENKKKNKDKIKIFKKVYERIDRTIILANSKDYENCKYEVPEFLLGVPLYDLNECIKYIDEILEKNGFKREWDNNIVFIDWSDNEKN